MMCRVQKVQHSMAGSEGSAQCGRFGGFSIKRCKFVEMKCKMQLKAKYNDSM